MRFLAAPLSDGARSEAKTPGNRPDLQLHPSRSLDATSPRDQERRGGGAPVHWMRPDDHVMGQEKKKEGKKRLVGDCQSKKNIFMRLELWHEKKRFTSLNVPLFLAQLHYVKFERLISCGCRNSDTITVSLETKKEIT